MGISIEYLWIPKYIYLGCIYGEYLSLLLSLFAYLSFVGWAAMNLPTGTLTAQHVARQDTYIERTCVCHHLCR